MACCLTSPSHYLNQSWLIINEVLGHPSEGNFTWNARPISPLYECENYQFKKTIVSPSSKWVMHHSVRAWYVPGSIVIRLGSEVTKQPIVTETSAYKINRFEISITQKMEEELLTSHHCICYYQSTIKNQDTCSHSGSSFRVPCWYPTDTWRDKCPYSVMFYQNVCFIRTDISMRWINRSSYNLHNMLIW